MMIVYLLAVVAAWWIEQITAASGLGGLFFVLLTALFAGLKLTGTVDWAWWWVALPLWAVLVAGPSKYRWYRATRTGGAVCKENGAAAPQEGEIASNESSIAPVIWS